MKCKVCVPIMVESLEALRVEIGALNESAEMIEVYTDLINVSPAELIATINGFHGEKIFTLRRPNFKPCRMSTEEQRALLKALAHTEIICDFDYIRESALLAHAIQLGVRCVPSYHDYVCTPSAAELETIVSSLRAIGPDLVKIACLCRDGADGVRLLNVLLREREEGRGIIVSPMGQGSLSTRIMCGLWGSSWIYAPRTVENQTAEGQATLATVQKILQLYQEG